MFWSRVKEHIPLKKAKSILSLSLSEYCYIKSIHLDERSIRSPFSQSYLQHSARWNKKRKADLSKKSLIEWTQSFHSCFPRIKRWILTIQPGLDKTTHWLFLYPSGDKKSGKVKFFLFIFLYYTWLFTLQIMFSVWFVNDIWVKFRSMKKSVRMAKYNSR